MTYFVDCTNIVALSECVTESLIDLLTKMFYLQCSSLFLGKLVVFPSFLRIETGQCKSVYWDNRL